MAQTQRHTVVEALGTMIYDTAVAVDISAGDDILSSQTYFAIYTGVGGDVKVDLSGTTGITLKNMASGQLFPLKVTKVYETGTTATNIVVLR